MGSVKHLPNLNQLLSYDRSWLRGDVVAGVTVAAYLVPQVMAYAEVAGLPPVVGLWAITGSLLVYAVIGSSRQLSVGPESTTALLTATAIAPLAAGDPEKYAALAAALAFIVGALCLVAWAARLGFLADLLSKPVLVGYMAGVAVYMIVSQLPKMIGLSSEGDSLFDQLKSFFERLDQAHGPTMALGIGVLVVLFVGARLFPRAPMPLIAMLLSATVVAVFDLQDKGIKVVGEIESGLPTPGLPSVTVTELTELLLPAFGLLVVAYTDNVLTARAFAVRNGYEIDANQEFLALGVANFAAGGMRGFPVSSSGSRTVIGDALGSRSQLYSLVALAIVIVTLMIGGDVLASFPTAALGALVIYAAVRLVDVAEFRRLARFRRSEFVLALATTAAVLIFGVLYGVLAAVGLSILNVLRRVARAHDGILGYVPGLAGMHDIDDYPDARLVPGLVVYRYDAPLFFVNAEDFRERALAAVDSSPTPVEWFILNAEANVEVDITALDALEQLRAALAERGIVFAMARVKQDLLADLRAAGLTDRVGSDRIFPTLPTAVQAFEEWQSSRT